MSENLTQLSRQKGLSENLFEKLIQSDGSLVELKQLAKEYKMGEANLFAAASSYDFITGDNAGKKVYICNGSACLCAGTQEKVSTHLSQYFSNDEIGHVTCLGRCHENSAFQIAGKNYSGEDYRDLKQIISSDTPSKEKIPVYCLLDQPILTASNEEVSTYYNLFAQIISDQTKNELLEEIILSGLRGRGGAGFPAGIKWRSCSKQTDPEKYIVCNADEGDPGAFSDRYLLEQRPHSVLFGMLMAGYFCAAQWGVIYIRDEYPDSVQAIERAIQEFNSLNLIPKDSKFSFKFKIIRGAGSYICGEETALLRSIEGQKPMVSVRPPFPAVKGLFGKPTVLNNVETFASIHYILAKSNPLFSSIGNGRSTGSKLVSLDSSFVRPGIYEVAMSESLETIIKMAGGFNKEIKALHIGGPLGGLVPTNQISKLNVDFESFSDAGFLLGHASIIGIPETQSIPEYVQHLFEFTAKESCGKCFPCRLGAVRGQEMFEHAIAGKHYLNQTLLQDLLETMEKGSLCALGGGVPLPVRNALSYFFDEFKAYLDPNDQQRINVEEL